MLALGQIKILFSTVLIMTLVACGSEKSAEPSVSDLAAAEQESSAEERAAAQRLASEKQKVAEDKKKAEEEKEALKAKKASLRNDIQVTQQSLSRVRADISRKDSLAFSASGRITQLDTEVATTVPEQTPPAASADSAALYAAWVARQNAIKVAEQKKTQLRALAETLRADLKNLEAEVAELEIKAIELEDKLTQLNDELRNIE